VNIIDLVKDLPRGPRPYKRRYLTSIDTIVLHHSATITGTPQAFAEHHVKSKKWPGIGYHYVVGKKGEIWQTNDATTISYHAANYNGHSLGVCMVGNFDEQRLEGPQKESVLSLLRYLLEMHPGVKHLYGHKETGGKTACPGKNISMDEIRAALGVEK
jgi:N-acetylmuramoyl-L-alanine amidase